MTPEQILDQAVAEHQPAAIFCLFSGGHDSLTATHLAMRHLGDRAKVLTLNTGIGIEQTREFVRETCRREGWPLLEYRAAENTQADGTPDPQIYEDIVLKYGFPGAGQHMAMYARLKERPLRCAIRDHAPKGKVMLVSGVRKQESTRRMGHVEPIAIDEGSPRRIWVAPICEFDALQVSEYVNAHKLPRNPVKDYLHMSGECLCGAYAKPGELKELELWFPEAANTIKAIQRKTAAAGFPWGWEDNIPPWWTGARDAEACGQLDAFEGERMDEIQRMCAACHKRAE